MNRGRRRQPLVVRNFGRKFIIVFLLMNQTCQQFQLILRCVTSTEENEEMQSYNILH